jgi:succinate-acetate transporter protein
VLADLAPRAQEETGLDFASPLSRLISRCLFCFVLFCFVLFIISLVSEFVFCLFLISNLCFFFFSFLVRLL